MGLLIIAIIAAAIIFTVLIIYFIFFFNFVFLGHNLPTGKEAQALVEKFLVSNGKTSAAFFDLGCATGIFSCALKEHLPNLNITAADKDCLRILLAKLRAKLLKRDVNFITKNIFALDVSRADVVYTYLWYSVMPPLEKKLLAELKPGAIVIANESFFPTWRPVKVIDIYPGKNNSERLFIYKK